MIPFVLLYNDSEKEVHLNRLSFRVSSTERQIIRRDIDAPALALHPVRN